ncbi:thioredoxin [Bordetella ansorpii]|uniref:Thioredoxin n=1 Tax=Bordetella ansorpii TaxID=288768 RepID=A0A157SMH9_9BORD|nr:thioredoxin [Bordetella ansorpii]
MIEQHDLDDGTADRFLLDARGISLLVFHSRTCGTCRVAREQLPAFDLPVERLCWIDAGDNGGLVERYEVFHLPAMFVVRDGTFHGAIAAQLAQWDIEQQLALALDNYPAELP